MVNYQLKRIKLSHISNPDIQDPTNHGWTTNDNNFEAAWSEGKMLPDDLVQILKNDVIESDDSSSGENSNFEDNIQDDL